MRIGKSCERRVPDTSGHIARKLMMRAGVALLAGAAALSPLSAAPADAIRTRIAGFRDLGASFKSLNDALRRGDGNPAAITQATRRIHDISRAQYGWFPRGSGPAPGLKTAAKPQIWADAAKFKSAQDAFAAQAQAVDVAARSGNAAALQSQARRLGAVCKSCHDSFRSSDD